MTSAIVLTATALITSGISAITGLGGGTILVAVMFALGLAPQVAVPLHAVVQLVSNAARTIAYRKAVKMRALVFFLLAAVPAPFIVAPLVAQLPAAWVRLTMGLFLLGITIRPPKKGNAVPAGADRLAMFSAGVLAGGLGTVVGATGSIIAPCYLRPGWTKEAIVGTKALCQAAAHIVKIVAFASFGMLSSVELHLAPPVIVAVVVGTVVGKRWAGRLSEPAFRRIFRLLILALGIKLCVTALWQIWH